MEQIMNSIIDTTGEEIIFIEVHNNDGCWWVEEGDLCYGCKDLEYDVEVSDLTDLTISQYNELVEKLNKHYPDYAIETLTGRFI